MANPISRGTRLQNHQTVISFWCIHVRDTSWQYLKSKHINYFARFTNRITWFCDFNWDPVIRQEHTHTHTHWYKHVNVVCRQGQETLAVRGVGRGSIPRLPLRITVRKQDYNAIRLQICRLQGRTHKPAAMRGCVCVVFLPSCVLFWGRGVPLVSDDPTRASFT